MAQISEFIPAELEYDIHPEQKTDTDTRVEALAAALRADPAAFVTIHRILGGGNSPEEFCTRIPADKFDYGQLLDYLARTYGGGEYRVRMYAKGRIVSNQLIPIAMALKTDNKSGGDAAGILATVLDRMEANNQRMMQMMQSAISSKVEPTQTRADILNEMLMYKQMFSDNKPSAGLGQLHESISLLKELGIKVGGKDDDDDSESFTSMLGKVAPLIVQAAQQPIPQRRPNPQPPQTRTPEMLLNMKIKMGLKPFLNAAAKNSEPAIYAEMLLDQLDIAVIESHILPSNSVDKLGAIEPAVLQFRSWFELMKEHVKAQLGMHSTVSHLYDETHSDITQEYSTESASENGTDLHTTSN